LTTPPPRFYRGDLPPRTDDLDRVRRALRRGPATRQQIVDKTGLTQTRILCAIDALIAAGEVAYDAPSRQFVAQAAA